MTAQDRQVLFERCMAAVDSPTAFVESWFHPTPAYSSLGRGNLQDLLAWSMFHKRDWETDMSLAEREQLESMVEHVESRVGKLQLGRNMSYNMLDFTEERVDGKLRPLIMYMIVDFLFQSVMAPAALTWNTYKRGKQGDLTYWYRVGKKPELPPVVFIHGIGIGILPYQNWLRKLEAKCDAETGPLAGRSILLPDIQVISQRLNPSELHSEQFVPDMKRALKKSLGQDKALFIGHSYGTFITSWMLRRCPEMVAGAGLIDPVCLMLHSTDVLHNIVYQESSGDSVEWVLDYVMRSEVSLVHNLKRQFYWYESILFFEQVDTVKTPMFVCLSDSDQLVPLQEIQAYIQRYNNGKYIQVDNGPAIRPTGQIDLLWLDKCDHAGYLFNSRFEDALVDAIQGIAARAPVLGEE